MKIVNLVLVGALGVCGCSSARGQPVFQGLAHQNWDAGQREWPYRTFDGGKTFEDISRKSYLELKNGDVSEWRVIAGCVLDVPRQREFEISSLTFQSRTNRVEGGSRQGLIVAIDEEDSSHGAAGGAGSRMVHLINYPREQEAVDGKYICAVARCRGRAQFTTVQGATATLLSYDHGALPSAEQFAAMEGVKRSNYMAQVQAAVASRTNRAAARAQGQRSGTNWTNGTNYSITPRRDR